ncbi:MAG TPA: transcriptional regulator [Sedimentisphaerales bacterium]|nr:transcriptional regulator [Sedimentisphaerales bacterium]
MKRSRISRVMQILTTLQAGKSYAVSDLSKMFGTSRRTIFRDLKELQAIGVPFHYDAKTGGYTIEPEFFLPPVDLSLQEALGLLLLAHKAREQIQLPFKNSVLWAALKIENNLPAKIRQYCNTALQNISTRPCAQAPVTHSAGLDKTFAQLQQAIVKKRKVNIRYHSLFEGTIIDVELSPYHLLYNKRAWYVLGRSSLHKSVRTFKLNRIRELTTTQRCFVDGEKFDVYDYLGRAWSMIPEGRIYNIKLRFLPKVANNVAEVQWHSTQKVVHNSDGSATVEFRVDGLGEITWWILGYGDQVQVLAPKTLRKKVLEVAKNMTELNEKI